VGSSALGGNAATGNGGGIHMTDSILTVGNTDAAEQLDALGSILGKQGTKTVASLVGKVTKAWKADGKAPAYPSLLKSVLQDIETAYRASGPVGVANDYKKLLDLFDGSQNGVATTYFTELERALNAAPPRASKAKTTPDVKKIREFADKLTDTIEHTSDFLKQVDELGAGRRFSKDEVNLVADQFLGYSYKYKSKKQAIDAIKRRQRQDELGRSQRREIEKRPV
jgi:hypothetical protein